MKQKMRSSNFPPPDTYNPSFTPTKERLPAYSFGSGKRAGLAESKGTPAPGTY
jgi:hypothetical protein